MRALLLPMSAIAVLLLACGSEDASPPSVPGDGSQSEREGGPVGSVVGVYPSEYTMRLSQRTAPAGPVTLVLENEGNLSHQVVVLRTEYPADEIPVDGNGYADTQADGVSLVYKEEAFPPGDGPELALTLEPGHYVFLCNLPGHYSRGMTVDFVAEEAPSQGGN